MEGDVDALERDGGEATLEFDGVRFRLGLFGALLDDFDEVGLDVVEREGFDQGVDVHFLSLEVVGDACEAIEGSQVTGADVLHVGNVVVDNLQQPFGFLCDVFDHVLQGLLVEGFGDSAWVDSAHGIIRPASGIPFDSNLHS